MGLVLKELLKNLCCSNGWSYGVFWSFDQRNSMLLTMEDVYYEEEMGVVVNNMLQQVHMLGEEGIVGQVALSGKNQWIISNDDNGGQNSEIHCQFSFGLKTIAVIPVQSRGVLQFGSTHKIFETPQILDQIERLFNGMETVSERTSAGINPTSSLNYENCEINEWFDFFCNGNITPMHSSSSCNELMEIAYSSVNFTQSTDFPSDLQQEKMDPFCFASSHLTSSMQTESETGLQKFPEELKLDDIAVDFSSCFASDNPFEYFVSESAGVGNVPVGNQFSEPANSVQSSITDHSYFCSGQEKMIDSCHSDLLECLGLKYETGERTNWQENTMKPIMSCGVSTSTVSECISELDVHSKIGSKKGLFSELGIDQLLNGVNNNSSIDDQLFTAKRRRMESSSLNQVQSGSISCCNGSIVMQSSYQNKDKAASSLASKKEIFPNSQVGLWIDDSYSINNGSGPPVKAKKINEPTKATKKRARPGESGRPRPKDRQQIQDLIKELKGIIPDGGKCSIDALLDRTIKYMLFLQSVTKYAEKLKQVDEPKLIGKEQKSVPKDNRTSGGGGATWALEVGDESTTVCPIIVEDLTPSGLMLIEMLCEDRGLFLEIADIIRGFGLNIVKGVMETRQDKLWAHFIVEAKTGVTRIELFWSLLQLTSTASHENIPSLNNFEQPCPYQ
ncbi:transcription factor bHLH157 [Mercurialis annua]|uniref:transcription factor bHLH157 n=1 Tax=Mercurialis annua TaxID=3986 RepID=UPI00215EA794|nr:transcription factor bHLH157 [Mercurialis annua]